MADLLPTPALPAPSLPDISYLTNPQMPAGFPGLLTAIRDDVMSLITDNLPWLVAFLLCSLGFALAPRLWSLFQKDRAARGRVAALDAQSETTKVDL